MRFILAVMLFCFDIYAQTIVNGTCKIISTHIDKADDLYVDNKSVMWIKNPINPNLVFTIIAAGYKDVGKEIVYQNGLDKRVFKVIQGRYKKEQIKVNPSKITPPESKKEQIEAEFKEASRIYTSKSIEIFFDKKFIYPMNSVITSEFGTARIFNGTLKSFHGGVDYRCAQGTQILSVNDGVVRIAKQRYFAGGSVVIDHGYGIYSQYYHLSEIYLKVGDRVKQGDIIGLSGASGRVSGPHLHFGIIVNNTQIDPLLFIKEINLIL